MKNEGPRDREGWRRFKEGHGKESGTHKFKEGRFASRGGRDTEGNWRDTADKDLEIRGERSSPVGRNGNKTSQFHQRHDVGQLAGRSGELMRGQGKRGRLMDLTGARSTRGGKYSKSQAVSSESLSSKFLLEIIHKEPSEAATELGSLKAFLQSDLNKDPMDELRQCLFWKVLAFICGALGADQTVIMLLTMTLNSKLCCRHLRTFLTKLRRPGEEICERRSTMLRNISTVFLSTTQSLPSRASDIKVPVTLMSDLVSEMYEDEIRNELMESIKSLDSHIEDIEKEIERQRQIDRVSKNPPPNDFRHLEILPKVEEIQTGYQPFLRPHLTRGVYIDANHYLDVQFRLLKEDFIYPLRNGISEYVTFKKNNPNGRAKPQDVRIYEEVHYTYSSHDNSGISHYLSFKNLPHVNWNSSKRLMYGSLLMLSTDDFKSFILATVAQRDIEGLEEGRVAVSLVDRENVSCLLNKMFVMAESSIFFEAYRPVLLGLQRISAPCLPFSRYILNLSSEVMPPKYLEGDLIAPADDDESLIDPGVIDISPLLKQTRKCSVRALDNSAWPGIEEVQLDQSQYEAAKTALTREVSIIQGPPGTGKTYIGLKIVRTLLINRCIWSSEENPRPILLVCYTNHALDQFLEGIIKFQTTGIVRVGSRSKSQQLEDFNLSRLVRNRRGANNEEYVQQRVRNIKTELNGIKQRIEWTQARIESARFGIVNEHELGPFMSLQHYESLMRHADLKMLPSWLVEWLLCESQQDRDWNQQKPEDYQQEKEKQEVTKPDSVNNGTTVEVEYERSAIEFDRMIDDGSDEEDEYSDETSEEDEYEDNSPLGLDLKNLIKEDEYYLRCYIQKKLSVEDVIELHELQSIMSKDVWTLHPNDRWALYHIWVKNYLEDMNTRLSDYETKFKQLCVQLDEARDIDKYHALREATLIGMTTTGAAKHQQVLHRVRPKIVIVEEAAEVLEGHIITSLNESCQQLILIGDHQQLRPKPNVFLLAKKYHLDVSLFERLINNGFPYSQLEIQHRMRMEMSELMKRNFYNNLQDHETVKTYKSVKGVQKNVFFLDHAEPEDEMEDTQSHYNLHEARFIVKLCCYFMRQGYQPGQITILTAYTGQLLKIKQMMNDPLCAGVHVTTVDNYQGEENDIIFLSYVRSNNHGNIGFLGISNRVCVSLSRAKMGLFCIGNFTLYAEKSDLWKGIVTDLESWGSIGDSLILKCTNHPDVTTQVKTDDDFKKVPEGGCNRDCEARLRCGHVCRMKCHPTDKNHLMYKCKAPCSKVICKRSHECPRLCSDPCPFSCSVMVEKELPCHHECITECDTDIQSIDCQVRVEKTLSCSHVRNLPCHASTDGLERECKAITIKELQCGHRKTEECSGTGRCDEIVSRVLKCGHICEAKCHTKLQSNICEERVEKTLSCGHTYTLLCSTNTDSIRCTKITKKLLPCGHEIIDECSSNAKCSKIVKKKLPCGHKVYMMCSTDVETEKCEEMCEKELPCGHSCKEICARPCTKNCQELIARNDWPCGHEITVKCSDESDACYIPCGELLKCGQPCKGTCGGCSQGLYHLPCNETCKKKLVCGHQCNLKCGAPCLSCKKKCSRRCRHLQCNLLCSDPCEGIDECMKRCKWRCDHYECKKLCFELCDRPPCDEPCPKPKKCGHPCIGLCGEICPNKCRICDKGDEQLRFFGTEDIKTARYIQLEDCGHYFEVKALDHFLGLGKKNDGTETFTKLSVKACPSCEKPIQLSRRYGNLLKKSLKIKPLIVEKLKHASDEDKYFLSQVTLAIESARETIRSMSSSKLTSRFRRVLQLQSDKPMVNQLYIDKLRELLKISTDKLADRYTKSSQHELLDQRAGDLCNGTNRIKIMCNLAKVLKTLPSNKPIGVRRLLSELETGRSMTRVNSLLDLISNKNDISLTSIKPPALERNPPLSLDVSMWSTCPEGHPLSDRHLKMNKCKDCIRETRMKSRAVYPVENLVVQHGQRDRRRRRRRKRSNRPR
nr:NFX1-type zinc finger-containing protein 1-like [Lytechinus pictus]